MSDAAELFETLTCPDLAGEDLRRALIQLHGSTLPEDWAAAFVQARAALESGVAEAGELVNDAGLPDDGDDGDDFTVDSLEGLPVPPRTWHVPDLIPSGTVTSLSADGAVGKTLLALQLGCATTGACDWIGRGAPRQGRVFYLSAEEGRDELHRRLDGIATFYGAPLAAFAGFKLWPVAESNPDPVLAATSIRGGDRVEPTPLWAEFEERVALWKPSLIVIDPSAEVFAINENVRSQVVQAVSLLRRMAVRHDAAVLLLSHPSLTGMSTGTGMSGSTGWNNAVRSRLYMRRPAAADGDIVDPDIRELTLMKANFGPVGQKLRLRYSCGAFTCDGDGDGIVGGSLGLAAARDRVDRLFLELLDAFTAAGRRVSDSTGKSYAPSLFANDPRAQGNTSKGFTGAMDRLFVAREIEIRWEGPPSRLRSRLVRRAAPSP